MCGDAANGKLYRKALVDKVKRCPYTKDAKAAFSEWADTAETEGSAEIKRYIATGLDGFFTDDPALGRAAIGS